MTRVSPTANRSGAATTRRCRKYARALCGGFIVCIWFRDTQTVTAIIDGDEEARARIRRTFEGMRNIRERFESQRGSTDLDAVVAQAFAEYEAGGDAYKRATEATFDVAAIRVCCAHLEECRRLLSTVLHP